MLIPYTTNFEKVVMGLLSYVTEYKNYETLLEEMDRIKTGSRSLYLWRDQETENIIGLIGFDENNKDQALLIRYLSINPSFRNEGLSLQILSALKEEFPIYSLTSSIETAGLIKKWAQRRQKQLEQAQQSISDGLPSLNEG